MLLREITVCTVQLYRTLQKGNTMCTHAPGGDVKINVVSFPPIIQPPTPIFSAPAPKKSASIFVAARTVKCITKGTTARGFFQGNVHQKVFLKAFMNWTQDESPSCLVSDTEQESCVFYTLQQHYLWLNVDCEILLKPVDQAILWNTYCLFGCAVLQNCSLLGTKGHLTHVKPVFCVF